MNRNEMIKIIDNRYVTKIVMDDGNILDLRGLPERMKEADLLNWVQVGAWPEVQTTKKKTAPKMVCIEPQNPRAGYKKIELTVHGEQYIRLNAKRVVYFETEEMEVQDNG